ncbi:hypothetical protein, partial [Tabrizicola sp.]|uniref:hypothetical protein n=1 Tax=Tabrizicola sp. TaxID=2005166 RepID=UPI003F3D3C56
LSFQPAPTVGAQFGSYAALSSSIAGDALATGPTANQPSGSAIPDGALVDPATTVTAFLSATQLAALDDNQFSFY